jgi:hypothetical protein
MKFIDGCLPETNESYDVYTTLKDSAIPFNQLYESGDMPIMQWNLELIAWLQKRKELIADINKDKPG